MDPVSFVVTTVAGAVLKKLAEDSYGGLKKKLIQLIGPSAVQAVEADPASEHARKFLGEQIEKSDAARSDPELPRLAVAVADELAKLPDEEDLGGNISVRDIKAGRNIVVRQLEANPGSGISIEGIRASGTARFENLQSGWRPPS